MFAPNSSPVDFKSSPAFRRAVEMHARECLEFNDRRLPIVSWLAKDVGRASILARLVIRGAQDKTVTAADIVDITTARNTASAGRALLIFRRMEGAKLIKIADGPGSWTSRAITVMPDLTEAFRARMATEIRAAAVVVPALEPMIAMVRDNDFVRRFFQKLGEFDRVPADMRGPRTPAIRYFLQHDAGLLMLCDLMLKQAAERKVLLERAPFVRSQLSKRFHVSRIHVNRVFREAARLGYLSIEDERWVTFSPAMSEEAEQHYALTFAVMHASALAAR